METPTLEANVGKLTFKMTTDKDNRQFAAVDRTLLLILLEGLAHDKMEKRDKGRGEYRTTGQDNVRFEDSEGGTYAIGYSINYWPKASKKDASFKLTAKEQELIEKKAVEAEQAGDTASAETLRTLKAKKFSVEDLLKLQALAGK